MEWGSTPSDGLHRRLNVWRHRRVIHHCYTRAALPFDAQEISRSRLALKLLNHVIASEWQYIMCLALKTMLCCLTKMLPWSYCTTDAHCWSTSRTFCYLHYHEVLKAARVRFTVRGFLCGLCVRLGRLKKHTSDQRWFRERSGPGLEGLQLGLDGLKACLSRCSKLDLLGEGGEFSPHLQMPSLANKIYNTQITNPDKEKSWSKGWNVKQYFSIDKKRSFPSQGACTKTIYTPIDCVQYWSKARLKS